MRKCISFFSSFFLCCEPVNLLVPVRLHIFGRQKTLKYIEQQTNKEVDLPFQILKVWKVFNISTLMFLIGCQNYFLHRLYQEFSISALLLQMTCYSSSSLLGSLLVCIFLQTWIHWSSWWLSQLHVQCCMLQTFGRKHKTVKNLCITSFPFAKSNSVEVKLVFRLGFSRLGD